MALPRVRQLRDARGRPPRFRVPGAGRAAHDGGHVHRGGGRRGHGSDSPSRRKGEPGHHEPLPASPAAHPLQPPGLYPGRERRRPGLRLAPHEDGSLPRTKRRHGQAPRDQRLPHGLPRGGHRRRPDHGRVALRGGADGVRSRHPGRDDGQRRGERGRGRSRGSEGQAGRPAQIRPRREGDGGPGRGRKPGRLHVRPRGEGQAARRQALREESVIKFGVMSNSHPASAADLSRLVDEMAVEAQQAEKYGFDSFFVTEHHQEPSGYLPSPLPLLAALAARTSTIRLGTGIAVLPLYHPIRMAEDCAVIDIISKGRLILGVGMGYQDVDFAAYGLRVSERVSLFEEGIEIIKRAWTEEKLYFVGKRYTLTNISVTPKPVQKPRPPIWVAAVGDEAMKRAGRVGDALLADSFQLPARLKPRVDLYRQTAASRGNRSQVVLFREGFV